MLEDLQTASSTWLTTSRCVGPLRISPGLEKRQVFVDGPDECVFYDSLIDHPVASIAIADWYHIEGDRIASIRRILDTGPFRLHHWRNPQWIQSVA
jgi:hypothetical protein